MAITAQHTTSQGVDLSAAYVNVVNARINKSVVSVEGQDPVNAYSLQFDAAVYASAQSFQAGLPCVDTATYCTKYEPAQGPFASAYEYLKTLPEFADAVGC